MRDTRNVLRGACSVKGCDCCEFMADAGEKIKCSYCDHAPGAHANLDAAAPASDGNLHTPFSAAQPTAPPTAPPPYHSAASMPPPLPTTAYAQPNPLYNPYAAAAAATQPGAPAGNTIVPGQEDDAADESKYGAMLPMLYVRPRRKGNYIIHSGGGALANFASIFAVVGLLMCIGAIIIYSFFAKCMNDNKSDNNGGGTSSSSDSGTSQCLGFLGPMIILPLMGIIFSAVGFSILLRIDVNEICFSDFYRLCVIYKKKLLFGQSRGAQLIEVPYSGISVAEVEIDFSIRVNGRPMQHVYLLAGGEKYRVYSSAGGGCTELKSELETFIVARSQPSAVLLE